MNGKSKKLIAALLTGLMLVMSFAEVPTVFAAGEAGEEPAEVVQNTESENEAAALQEETTETQPEEQTADSTGEGEQQPAEEEDEADYTKVKAALATVPDDLSIYTDETAAAVKAAVDAVVWDKMESQQAEVDAMAAAISKAVAALVLREAPGETVIKGYPVFANGKYYYVRLYATVADSVKKNHYKNSEGKVKVTIDARWVEGVSQQSSEGTTHIEDTGKTRVEDKIQALVKKGWQFVYRIKSTNGTREDRSDDTVIQGFDDLTYDDIGQKGKSGGIKIKAEDDKAIYIEVSVKDPNGNEQTAASLPRIVRYVFPDAPKNVKVECEDGDNVATVTWKKVKGASRYAIFMSTNGKCPSEPIAYTKKDSGVTEYVKKNLAGPKTYTFFVKALFYNEADTTGGTGGSSTKFYTISKASGGDKLKIKGYILGENIRVIKWTAKVKRSTTLYANQGCTSKKGTLSKGTKVYLTGKYPKKLPRGAHPTKLQVQLVKNGKVKKSGWVKYGPVASCGGEVAYKKGKGYDYSTSVKENYVNSKGFSSSKKYLIWVSTYTQRVNIFTGKKGKWKLLRSDRCTSGLFFHPTSLGSGYKVHRHQKTRIRTFLNSTSKYYYKNLSYFSSGNSFHTPCWRLDNNKSVNHVKENLQPGTQGCVRMQVEAATWIYNNIPLGTKVVVH